jgi:hypothetical protein
MMVICFCKHARFRVVSTISYVSRGKIHQTWDHSVFLRLLSLPGVNRSTLKHAIDFYMESVVTFNMETVMSGKVINSSYFMLLLLHFSLKIAFKTFQSQWFILFKVC